MVFTCSQYSRQLAYLDCRFDQLTGQAIPDCGCEEQYAADDDTGNSSAKDLSGHKNHVHISLDDYIFIETKNDDPGIPAIKNNFFHSSESCYNKYLQELLRPPQV